LYEPFTLDSIDTNISVETTFLDVGAYLGFMSLHVANRVKRVVAFEADPTVLPILRANINANPNWKNLDVVEGFVSNSDGTQTISSLHEGGNSGTTGVIDLGGESWVVKKIDFLNFLGSVPDNSPLIIKMDIEGAEYDVLRACGDALARRSNTCLLLELHPHLIAQSIPGTSILAKLNRRATLVRKHREIFTKLALFQNVSNCESSTVSLSKLIRELLRNGNLSPDHRILLFKND
jgi:FkbM family methyltransferase